MPSVCRAIRGRREQAVASVFEMHQMCRRGNDDIGLFAAPRMHSSARPRRHPRRDCPMHRGRSVSARRRRPGRKVTAPTSRRRYRPADHWNPTAGGVRLAGPGIRCQKGRAPLRQIRFDQDRRMARWNVLGKPLQLIRDRYIPPCTDPLERRQSLHSPLRDRSEQYQPADGIGVVPGEQPGNDRAPGMRHDMNTRNAALCANMVHQSGELGSGSVARPNGGFSAAGIFMRAGRVEPP